MIRERSTRPARTMGFDPSTTTQRAKPPGKVGVSLGADDRDRTGISCLEGRGSTIELHPHSRPERHREKASLNVGVTGLEPAASCSQSRCATNCATPRLSVRHARPERSGATHVGPRLDHAQRRDRPTFPAMAFSLENQVCNRPPARRFRGEQRSWVAVRKVGPRGGRVGSPGRSWLTRRRLDPRSGREADKAVGEEVPANYNLLPV